MEAAGVAFSRITSLFGQSARIQLIWTQFKLTLSVFILPSPFYYSIRVISKFFCSNIYSLFVFESWIFRGQRRNFAENSCRGWIFTLVGAHNILNDVRKVI